MSPSARGLTHGRWRLLWMLAAVVLLIWVNGAFDSSSSVSAAVASGASSEGSASDGSANRLRPRSTVVAEVQGLPKLVESAGVETTVTASVSAAPPLPSSSAAATPSASPSNLAPTPSPAVSPAASSSSAATVTRTAAASSTPSGAATPSGSSAPPPPPSPASTPTPTQPLPSPSASGPPSPAPTSKPTPPLVASPSSLSATEVDAFNTASGLISSLSLCVNESWPDTTESRRLQAELRSPMRGCSARWIETVRQYAAWHRAETARLLAGGRAALDTAPVVMVYRCHEPVDETSPAATEDCGGLSDRFSGMSHVFLTALRHRFLFYAMWNGRTAAFNSPFDWDYSWDGRVSALFNDAGQPDGWAKYYHFISCPFAGEYRFCPAVAPRALWTARVNYVLTNKGVYQNIADPSPTDPEVAAARAAYLGETGAGLDMTSWAGCLLRALVQPSARVVAQFKPEALRMLRGDALVVALHARMGDEEMHGRQNSSGFNTRDEGWQCAQQHVRGLQQRQTGRPVRVFYAVDSAAMKAAAVAAVGEGDVFVSSVQPRHISLYQLRMDYLDMRKQPGREQRLVDSFGDWWMLSLADVMVLPGSSGYSRSAACYGHIESTYATHNFQGLGFYSCDRKLKQYELSSLGSGM